MRDRWCFLILVAVIVAVGVGDTSAQTNRELAAGFEKATAALRELVGMPDKGIPRDLLARAQAVAVFPGVVKGAFFFGGQLGNGVMSVRRPDGSWSPPALFTLGGGSYGLQFGGEVSDIVLVVTSRKGVDSLLRSKITLGADVSVAAGPLGRRAEAATDIRFQADILSYSRTKGLFAGISVGGGTVHPDDDDNKQLYGRALTAREILTGDQVTAPSVAREFLETLTTYASPAK